MTKLGLDTDIVDQGVYARTVARFREARIALPSFAQLTDPSTMAAPVRDALAGIAPDDAHALNLFRVHWHNGPDRRAQVAVPEHVVLPSSLTGVAAPIIVAFGDRFPLIHAHKVLAAYACLVPRLVTGQFDPTAHKAVWPSTGNYCRGGVAISRILGCRGVAVLPEGMSEERFAWLTRWVSDPADIIRTPGTESNVKEIYDECHRLEADPQNVIFNQFCEFGNHLVHYQVTGRALGRVFEHVQQDRPGARLAAFVSATGSAGTIAAGDYLKDAHGARTVAVEALECPTMLYNGYGEHNIQGIGDKHIPLIHNVTNTDVITAISDRATDTLEVVFASAEGRAHLVEDRGVPAEIAAALPHFGLSSICNLLAAIKTAKALDLGPDDAVITVATDGSAMYSSEMPRALDRYYGGGLDRAKAGRAVEEHLLGADRDHLLVLDDRDRDRVFNLGYFTWVEQQGVALADFEKRRSQDFWRGLRPLMATWDERIEAFNRETGVVPGA
ncbi:pyridoxal-phosphate dependent enzyme [Haliangium sp.]|uniref:pyridoxal-phosphate dependent enzyme n=1 Tax=Haliangium sp. TaxID=2663208 RepID=UPI003D09FA01